MGDYQSNYFLKRQGTRGTFRAADSSTYVLRARILVLQEDWQALLDSDGDYYLK